MYFRLKTVGKHWDSCRQEALLTQGTPPRLQFFGEGLDREESHSALNIVSFTFQRRKTMTSKLFLFFSGRITVVTLTESSVPTTPLSMHTPASLLLLHIHLQLFSCLSCPRSRTEAMLANRQLFEILARNQCTKHPREVII